MKTCPLIQKECLGDSCEWYASGISRCTLVALGMLCEGLHDMGVGAYNRYVPAEEVVDDTVVE